MLEDGQAVVLNPGRTGGALEFAQILTRFACAAEIVLGEAADLRLRGRIARAGERSRS